MLGSRTKASPTATTTDAATCVIAKGTAIEGKFNSSENVRIDGSIVGDVFCDNRLVMGDTGKINGIVKVNDAVIMGTVKGEIHAKGTLHLMATANIDGLMVAQSLIVEEGATYNGECRVGGLAKS